MDDSKCDIYIKVYKIQHKRIPNFYKNGTSHCFNVIFVSVQRQSGNKICQICIYTHQEGGHKRITSHFLTLVVRSNKFMKKWINLVSLWTNKFVAYAKFYSPLDQSIFHTLISR